MRKLAAIEPNVYPGHMTTVLPEAPTDLTRIIEHPELAVSLLHHIAQATGMLPTTRQAHHQLVHKLLLVSGWGQVLGMAGGLLLLVAGAVVLIRRRRRREG